MLLEQSRGTRNASIPRLIAIGLALGLGLGRPVFAQEHGQHRAAAESLFNEAIGLMEAGDDAKACPKLEESQKLDPAPGTLMYLGECYDRIGRVASAWAAFNSAASAAAAARQRERVATAKKRAGDIAPKVPRLVIVVPADAKADGLAITRDGIAVGEAGFGAAVPVDPGEHVVKATAPGRQAWSHSVTAAADGQTATVTVPALGAAPKGAEPEAGSGEHGPASTSGAGTPSKEGSSGSSGTAQLVAGVVVGGVGLVGLVIGTVLGVQAKSRESDSEAYCAPADPTRCVQEGVDLIDRARTAATISNVGFIAGGVLVVGGLVLVLTAPSGSDDAASGSSARGTLQLGPMAGPTVAGLSLSGAW